MPPIEATLDFNYQVFAEDIAIVERQFPEDLPIDLQAEAHFPADRSSITYRKGLKALGLGRSYTSVSTPCAGGGHFVTFIGVAWSSPLVGPEDCADQREIRAEPKEGVRTPMRR